MGKGFAVSEPEGGLAKTHVWLTPREITDKLGPFDLDPCGAPNWKIAPNQYYEAANGLKQKWEGFVWMNPPYGKFTPLWMDKLAEHGNGIALVFSRTDTIWFQKALKQADCLFFKKGRIKFLNEKGKSTNSAGAPSCFFGYGKLAIERLSRLQGGKLLRLR